MTPSNFRLLAVTLLAATIAMPPLSGQGKGKGQPPPALMTCGVHGELELICGIRSPEDLEVTPDGRFLIVTQFSGGGGPQAGGRSAGGNLPLMLLDLQAKTYSQIPVTAQPQAGWGAASCPGPIDDALIGHGSSLTRRSSGEWQLFIVNHGVRQSMEMYELRQTGGNWGLVWRGCVLAQPGADYNDVAALPDGSYIATRPTALAQGGGGGGATSGNPSGNVARWTPAGGEVELPNTRVGYPNGVLVSEDGRFMYVSAWTEKAVRKYDLQSGAQVAMTQLDFMPDNATWTPDGHLLAAGIKSTGAGDCGALPCIQRYGVAHIDPETMAATTVYDSSAEEASSISGVSVALEAGDAIYVGAFQGDRIVKIQK